MKTEIYKNYELDLVKNEWGYYTATCLNDCDAPIIIDKTIKGIKTEIDELNIDQ